MTCKTLTLYQCAKDPQNNCLVEMVRCCKDGCEVSCCGEPMKALEPKTADQGKEKHVPVIEKVPGGLKVKIGSIPHPMEPDHYIEFIELRTGDAVYRKYLKPGMAPEAVFNVDAANATALEFCNKHGLWIS